MTVSNSPIEGLSSAAKRAQPNFSCMILAAAKLFPEFVL